MKIKNAAVAALRRSRRFLRAARSLSPMGVIAVMLVLVFGGVGIASAAATNTLYFILGKANDETTQAYLNNSTGTPLKLVAPANSAPLKVSNSQLVSGLNAALLDGQSASALQTTGSEGMLPPNTEVGLFSNTWQPVVDTADLGGGTYYVTATAGLAVAPGDVWAQCQLIDLNPVNNTYAVVGVGGGEALSATNESGTDGAVNAQAAETATVTVPANQPDELQEQCTSGGDHGSNVMSAGITAIQILASSSGTGSAHAGHSKVADRRELARHAR